MERNESKNNFTEPVNRLGAVELQFLKIIWQNEPVTSGRLVELAEGELGWKTISAGQNADADKSLFRVRCATALSVAGKMIVEPGAGILATSQFAGSPNLVPSPAPVQKQTLPCRWTRCKSTSLTLPTVP